MTEPQRCQVCAGPAHSVVACPPLKYRDQIGAVWNFDDGIYANTPVGWLPLGSDVDTRIAELEETNRGLDTALEEADDEIGCLSRQRDELQERGTALVIENQKRHMAVIAVEEMKREVGEAVRRATLAERIIYTLVARGTSALTNAEYAHVQAITLARGHRAERGKS
jgi:hypothetical protein